MDPRLWPEGSYELGSIHPSFCPEVFLGLADYVFLKLRMLLEALVVFCVTEPNFLKKKIFLTKKCRKWAQNTVFWIYSKILSLIFSEFGLKKNYIIFSEFILFVVFLHKSHTWEKSGSRYIGQNLLGQSDCRIFKSPISL